MELDGVLENRTEGRVCKVDSDIKRHFDSSYETFEWTRLAQLHIITQTSNLLIYKQRHKQTTQSDFRIIRRHDTYVYWNYLWCFASLRNYGNWPLCYVYTSINGEQSLFPLPQLLEQSQCI